MAEAATNPDAVAPARKSKAPLLAGLVLALAFGGGGYYAVTSGLILGAGHGDHGEAAEEVLAGPLPNVAFIPVEPLVVNLGETTTRRHLRFRAQLEVPSAYAAEVTSFLPRVTDVLNGYLRAIDIADIEDPSALHRLRAQMLRRVQIVTGEGRVRDLLIMEFVLS